MAEMFLSLHDVGEELGVSVQTVRRWVKAGELAAYQPGKEYRIKSGDLEEFLKTREVRPKGDTPPPRDGGAGDQGLRFVRAWRAFALTLALDWAENPPQSSREISPLVSALGALVDAGAFEYSADDDTATRGEISLVRNALAKLYKIADRVESAEVAAEMRGSLALVPDPRDNVA